jgi:meiotic recombination protein SPO11
MIRQWTAPPYPEQEEDDLFGIDDPECNDCGDRCLDETHCSDDDDGNNNVCLLPNRLNHDEDEMSVQVVLSRIEALAAKIIQALNEYTLPEIKPFCGNQNDNNGNDNNTMMNLTTTTTKRFTVQQSRSFTSVLLVLAYCHALLQPPPSNNNKKKKDYQQYAHRHHRTTTTREVYYFYVTHFKHQRECDAAIWDACRLLQVPRHALGLRASSRGWMAGDVQLIDRIHGTMVWDGGSSNCCNNEHGYPISGEWLSPASQRSFVIATRSATSILIVEKEGIYQRLVQDGFPGMHRCILVTGKGFPDLATRAAVHALHTHLDLPVLGLADCDPFGVLVLDTYAHGSVNDGRSYNVPVEWIGLRPSQVEYLSKPTSSSSSSSWTCSNQNHGDCQEEGNTVPSSTSSSSLGWPGLPAAVFQELTDLDRKRLVDGLLMTHEPLHPFVRGAGGHGCHHRRLQELQQMKACKVELEALHWLGMDFCSTFVGYLLDHYQKQRQNPNLECLGSNTEAETNEPPWMGAI